MTMTNEITPIHPGTAARNQNHTPPTAAARSKAPRGRAGLGSRVGSVHEEAHSPGAVADGAGEPEAEAAAVVVAAPRVGDGEEEEEEEGSSDGEVAVAGGLGPGSSRRGDDGCHGLAAGAAGAACGEPGGGVDVSGSGPPPGGPITTRGGCCWPWCSAAGIGCVRLKVEILIFETRVDENFEIGLAVFMCGWRFLERQSNKLDGQAARVFFPSIGYRSNSPLYTPFISRARLERRIGEGIS